MRVRSTEVRVAVRLEEPVREVIESVLGDDMDIQFGSGWSGGSFFWDGDNHCFAVGDWLVVGDDGPAVYPNDAFLDLFEAVP